MMKFIDLEIYHMGTNIIQRVYGKRHEVATQLVEEEGFSYISEEM